MIEILKYWNFNDTWIVKEKIGEIKYKKQIKNTNQLRVEEIK